MAISVESDFVTVCVTYEGYSLGETIVETRLLVGRSTAADLFSESIDLPRMVRYSLSKCSHDVRGFMKNNIIVCGSSTELSWIKEELQKVMNTNVHLAWEMTVSFF